MKKPIRERTTLTQVANLAKVSPSTVSLVLAGKADARRIPAETCQRVEEAAKALKYVPNLLTRSLRKGRTQVLSFFSGFRHRERGDQYMDRVSSAIETAGGEFGYDVLVHCNFHRTPREVYEFLNGGLADGVILFAPVPNDPLLPLMRESSLPVVIINGRDPEGQFSSVRDDVAEGMSLVAETLVQKGHKRVLGIGATGRDVRDADERLRLLNENLSVSGVEFVPKCAPVDPKLLRDEIADWLDDPCRPTAIFCWHDRLAYRVIEVIEGLGLSVPDDISIVGYDGIQWSSSTPHRAASVVVDLDEFASVAVRRIHQELTLTAEPPVEAALKVNLDPGTTLGPRPSLQRSNS